MKNYLLLAFAVIISVSAAAQRTPAGSLNHTNTIAVGQNTNPVAKTTAMSDTLEHVTNSDSLTLYYVGATSDSGYITGMNVYGDMGFAERYDINAADTVRIIGVVATFGGVISDTSTNSVFFRVWNVGAQIEDSDYLGSNYYDSGFPDTILTTEVEGLPYLGIPNTRGVYLFPDTPSISTSFFLGYEIGYSYYTMTDTIGLLSTLNGERTAPIYNTVNGDTVVNNVNVTEYYDGSWHDDATDDFLLKNDLAIYPIVMTNQQLNTGVPGVTRNNLAFYGCYPNPASNSTNIKFSLLQPADVTIQVTDMSGRVVNTVTQSNLGVGDHITPIQTSGLAAGDYLYLIHTSNGDGIASKLTVIK